LVEIIVKTDPFVTIHKLKWILQDTIAYRVIVHCLQMFEDIENVLQSGCALSTIRPSTDNTHSLHPPHQSTMMAYQLTKHALCLVIPEARVGSSCAVPKRPKRRQTISLLLAIDRFGVVAYELRKEASTPHLSRTLWHGYLKSKVNYGQRSFPSIKVVRK
jgi:hypothetical protein